MQPEWTRTYLGQIDGMETWTFAVPPCWLLIEDTLHPERDPWTTYWDGRGSPINCTTYRIIGYYKTPRGQVFTRTVTLYFEGDKLARTEGAEAPQSADKTAPDTGSAIKEEKKLKEEKQRGDQPG